MSQKLVSLNEDLSRLRSDGYHVLVASSSHLHVRDVPYVTPKMEVKRGIIVSVLDLAGNKTIPPESHVVFFVGEPPCDINGSPLPGVTVNSNQAFGEGLTPNHQMSRKPTAGATPGKYPNYYEKIKTCVEIISGPARYLDPSADARTHPILVPDEGESVFNYLDTAATKAGIVAVNAKLVGGKIGIVGVGGTGSYVLDLVAKTPVAEIHIFDGDVMLNHNAFRCPGATSIEDLEKKLPKVDYLVGIYSRMRKQVIPHACFVEGDSIEQLKGMTFVFICIDDGPAKQPIVERLEEWGIPFVDVGMGIQIGDDNTIAGVVTVTTSTPTKRDHLRSRVAFAAGEAANEYSMNVQIADLNALNAAFAVIKWKKLFGYYHDATKEHFSTYTIRSNYLTSEDCHES